jgi:CelD/BcsL family acetyltransferase involved in cellulose biosynthesis
MMSHLVTARGWERVEIPELAPEAAALAVGCPAELRLISERGESCPRLILCERASHSSVVSGRRRDVRQARHRAARRGETMVIRADATTWPQLFSDLVRLHRARWHSQGLQGVLDDPRVLTFHRRALPGLIERGIVRLCALAIKQRIAAVYYGFLCNARAYAYLSGFDPEFAFESPGTILLAYAIETARSEGAREFHFLRGREAYKYSWGAVDCWNRSMTLVRCEHGGAT